MRLIDADAARAKLQAARDKAKEGSAEKAAMNTFLFYLDACPTMEAQIVRHGRWDITARDEYEWGEITCSECGTGYDMDVSGDDLVYLLKFDYLYCPCCGARMDLEEKENDD